MIVREIRAEADPLAVIVDVLEGFCDFVKLVFELGVFVILALTLPENVLATVPVIRELELIVFEVVTLPVDVVDEEGVLDDKEHLEAVDDTLVVLELVAVADIVREL